MKLGAEDRADEHLGLAALGCGRAALRTQTLGVFLARRPGVALKGGLVAKYRTCQLPVGCSASGDDGADSLAQSVLGVGLSLVSRRGFLTGGGARAYKSAIRAALSH